VYQVPKSECSHPCLLNVLLIRNLDLTYQTCSFLLHAAQSVAIFVPNQEPFIVSKIEVRCAIHAASCNANSVTPRMWRSMTRRTRLPAPTIGTSLFKYQPSRLNTGVDTATLLPRRHDYDLSIRILRRWPHCRSRLNQENRQGSAQSRWCFSRMSTPNSKSSRSAADLPLSRNPGI